MTLLLFHRIANERYEGYVSRNKNKKQCNGEWRRHQRTEKIRICKDLVRTFASLFIGAAHVTAGRACP